MSSGPAAEYRARLEHRRALHTHLTQTDARISWGRLATFGAAAAIALLVWQRSASAWLLLAPAGAFVVLLVRHERVIRARDAAARAVAFYERGLARIQDRWGGTGEPGDRFRDDRHPYANDLDLFGNGSLFELLCIARTRSGEATLAAWLKAAASPTDIRHRQAAVAALAPALDLRESLALAGSAVRAGVDAEALVTWAEGPAFFPLARVRALAILISPITIVSLPFSVLIGDLRPFFGMLVVQTLFAALVQRRIGRALHAAERPARDLDILSHLLERLHAERFTAPPLLLLQGQLATNGAPAARSIRTLHYLVEMHDWQQNLFFAPIGAMLLWGTHLGCAIEAWRRRYGMRIGGWLETVGEFEALASIATYRYEHPDDSFPELVMAESGDAAGPAAVFEGTGLGHPLIPAPRVVRNDVRFSGETRLLVISGSNMSGKSTLLRTVGINAVLALAGAPVRAGSLRLSPLAVGATLRIQDSLQEGRSRFYAEITRIRELTGLAGGTVPLLFLLDELFHGTNSHDRLIGAAGVLRSLLDKGAIGLITTHDLALTTVADRLAPRATNVHFEDWFEGGEMRFDYRVKPGPVTRSNAIALMQAVGLDVGRRRHE